MLVKTKKNAMVKGSKGKVTKGLKVKHVMLLDTGDGAFTDHSIKVKPHNTDPSILVFKCTKKARLLQAMKDAGLKPITKIIKGSKHWIAFVGAQEFGLALASGNHSFALPSSTTKQLGA